MKPLVLLSATDTSHGEYTTALDDAGARVVRPAFNAALLDEHLAGIAGVVLSGGTDVAAALYGGTGAGCDAPDQARDAYEVALVRRARERALPTLAICRGLQLANVAFGGTLTADIATEYGEAIGLRHRLLDADGRTERGLISGHDVRFEPGSQIAQIVGAAHVLTGSRHHQAARGVADDLRVTGRTSDGIIEVLEARFATPFFLAVQWHPESTTAHDDGASRRIFAAFVSAAAAFAASPVHA